MLLFAIILNCRLEIISELSDKNKLIVQRLRLHPHIILME
jgi:hypothetical protein